jgi:transcriptional regulator with PAS, ATPase and Fis domain
MDTATALIESLPLSSVVSIEEGLQELQQAFEAREVKVASITLQRNGRTYRHIVEENQPGVQRTVEGVFTDTKITVSVTSPMQPGINAELQVATTSAAAAASAWADQTSTPTMLGSSMTMRRLDQAISRVARSKHIVLITGESGTGKTTAAQMIHDRSNRAAAPFVDINCAALPETLIESELFGYEKGAFTGATAQKKGLFEAAEGGTLFLDEIGELKLELQAKLLKAIEQKKIRRLGATKDVDCNVRVLAASSRNLQRMVKNGTFREDLYYRLAVLELDIPPLRDRHDDIRELVAKQLAVEQENAGLSLQLESKALTELVSYNWPGNIRQLFNVLARLACHAPSGTITAAQVRSELTRFRTIDPDTIILPEHCNTLLADESFDDFSTRVRGAVIEAVREIHGNMSRAAVRLKCDRSSLLRIAGRINSRNDKTGTTSVAA